MVVIRPVLDSDLEAVYSLSANANIGLTTLPHDKEVLARRIKESQRTFVFEPEKPKGETYLFVAEDTANHKLVGTSAIISKVGGFQPNYTYQIQTVTKESKLLNVCKEIQYFKLRIDHNGPSEIGTLFLSPEYRGRRNLGRLLSLSRFLFMAQFSHCFEAIVIAEMRGVIDDSGRSDFWEALGKHFFEVELKKADLMVMKDKSFIAELMPKHPIYLPLLPKEAQEVIGRAHRNTRPALHLLEQEGFKFTGEVDIFEAGPVVSCKVKKVRMVKESRIGRVDEIRSSIANSSEYIIANVNRMESFRACVGGVLIVADSSIALSHAAAKALKITIGDSVRYSPIRPISRIQK